MANEKVCIHNRFFPRFFLSLVMVFVVCPVFAASPILFVSIWGQEIKLKYNGAREDVKDLQIKISGKDRFDSDHIVTVTTKAVAAGSKSSSNSATKHKRTSIEKSLKYGFSSLPAVKSGAFSAAGEVAAELHTVLAFGYGLLFSKRPVLPEGQEGELTEESYTRFVERSTLTVTIDPEYVILSISDQAQATSSSATAVAPPAKIEITLRKSEARDELIEAVYDLEYMAGDQQTKISYLMERATNRMSAGFLKSKLISDAESFFVLSTGDS